MWDTQHCCPVHVHVRKLLPAEISKYMYTVLYFILVNTYKYPHVNYVWVITSWSCCPLNFAFVCQYGQRANDKAAATPLVEHAPAPGKGKKGKKDAKKDKLDDLKQELEMVHNINRLHVNLYNISSKKLFVFVMI